MCCNKSVKYFSLNKILSNSTVAHIGWNENKKPHVYFILRWRSVWITAPAPWRQQTLSSSCNKGDQVSSEGPSDRFSPWWHAVMSSAVAPGLTDTKQGKQRSTLCKRLLLVLFLGLSPSLLSACCCSSRHTWFEFNYFAPYIPVLFFSLCWFVLAAPILSSSLLSCSLVRKQRSWCVGVSRHKTSLQNCTYV